MIEDIYATIENNLPQSHGKIILFKNYVQKFSEVFNFP